jgi:transposase-like protein
MTPTMKTTRTRQVKSRSERFLESSVKNMRAALPDLTMEQFVMHNLETLFGLEREEYLEKAMDDKGNGYYSRSLQSLMKNGIMIQVPRTRTGGFAPFALQLFKMNQEQVNELVLTLYKKGMTTRDISDVMTDFFGDSVSHTTVANLAEQFHGIREAWERSPLDTTYHAIFCDCLFITVRRGDSYEKEAVYVAYGVTERNTRELLALAVKPTESTTTWRDIFASLTDRGVQNVSLVIADGITGMEDVIMEQWKRTKLQKCVVHKMRNVLNDIRPKEKQDAADDLKHVFDNFDTTATKEHAYEKVRAFVAKWETKYPTIAKHFHEKTLSYYFTYIDYPSEVRRMIYTTNSIENLNKHIRKGTKNKLSFESPERLLDYVFIIIKEFEHKNWTRFPVHQFSVIHRTETH